MITGLVIKELITKLFDMENNQDIDYKKETQRVINDGDTKGMIELALMYHKTSEEDNQNNRNDGKLNNKKDYSMCIRYLLDKNEAIQLCEMAIELGNNDANRVLYDIYFTSYNMMFNSDNFKHNVDILHKLATVFCPKLESEDVKMKLEKQSSLYEN